MTEDYHLTRFIEAVALGEIADQTFAEVCLACGLRPADCLDAPLVWLSTLELGAETRH